MAVHSLGPFNFVALSGMGDRGEPPMLLQEQIIPTTRPGVDGTAFILTGKRANPFQMRSGVDCAISQRETLITGYHLLKGGGGQVLVWNDVDYQQAYNVLYVVLDVQVLSVRRISAAVGGVAAVSELFVECGWTLNPIIAS